MKPRASIVYLTKNGGKFLQRSLEGIFRQETDFSFEVIAVDSGSTDGTLHLLADYPIHTECIAPADFNFGLTRDLGFSLGRGEILVTLSQDAIPFNNNWLQNLCAPFIDPSVAVVQGESVPNTEGSFFFWDKIRLFYFTREGRKWNRLHGGFGLSFVNCAIRKEVWEANRLGRIDMSEDKVFQRRIADGRHKIEFASEAKVCHSHQYDRNSLMKRCKNEGLGWRLAGVEYSRKDMLLDMLNPFSYGALIYGIMTLQVRTSAELLFPWIRPLYLFKGNHSVKRYVH